VPVTLATFQALKPSVDLFAAPSTFFPVGMVTG